jgi:hypothetical protein
MMNDGTTGTEKALAVAVNVLVWRGLADAAGRPGWWGAMLAAVGMAIAADPTTPPLLAKIGGIVSAPGALTVTVLRDQGITEQAADSPGPGPSSGNAGNNFGAGPPPPSSKPTVDPVNK